MTAPATPRPCVDSSGLEAADRLRAHLRRRIRRAVHARDLPAADQIANDAVQAFIDTLRGGRQ